MNTELSQDLLALFLPQGIFEHFDIVSYETGTKTGNMIYLYLRDKLMLPINRDGTDGYATGLGTVFGITELERSGNHEEESGVYVANLLGNVTRPGRADYSVDIKFEDGWCTYPLGLK